jgi:hypothetical protein
MKRMAHRRPHGTHLQVRHRVHRGRRRLHEHHHRWQLRHHRYRRRLGHSLWPHDGHHASCETPVQAFGAQCAVERVSGRVRAFGARRWSCAGGVVQISARCVAAAALRRPLDALHRLPYITASAASAASATSAASAASANGGLRRRRGRRRGLVPAALKLAVALRQGPVQLRAGNPLHRVPDGVSQEGRAGSDIPWYSLAKPRAAEEGYVGGGWVRRECRREGQGGGRTVWLGSSIFKSGSLQHCYAARYSSRSNPNTNPSPITLNPAL